MIASRINRRNAVTLIELLVVIGIMLTLLGLAAMVLPALRQKNNSVKAASQIQGYLSIAKQQAIRDGAPRGIRLISTTDPIAGTVVREIQYIEVPLPVKFRPEFVLGDPTKPAVGTPTVTLGIDLGLNASIVGSVSKTWVDVNVENGDYLSVTKNSIDYLFELRISNASSLTATLLPRSGLKDFFTDPVNPAATAPQIINDNFSVIRRARPLVGEPSIQLPPKTLINLNAGKSYPTNPTLNPWSMLSGFVSPSGNASLCAADIIFNANGEGFGSLAEKLILWVEPENGAAGEPTLVVIYTRTGAVMLQPVADPSDPYFYTKDGQGSGY